MVKFGIKRLDDALLPVEPGNQIVIGAETSGGKTALACQAVLSSPEQSFAIFSLEMQARALITRMFAGEGGIPLSNLRCGRLTSRELPRLHAAVERLSPRVIYI
jgi:replicative DNA helicase